MNLLAREPARAEALGRTLVAILTAAGRAPGPAPESAALDEESRQRLAALGYLGRSGDTSSHGFDRSKEDPKDLIAFFRKDQRLNKLVEEKKYAEARALCDEMLRQRPGFADCHLQMSKIAAADGNLDAALTAAPKAVAVGPKNERAHLQLAALLKERGDLDGAIAHFREALALEPTLARHPATAGPRARGEGTAGRGGEPARRRGDRRARRAPARPPSWASSWPSRASSRRPSRATVARSPSTPARPRPTPTSARPWPPRRQWDEAITHFEPALAGAARQRGAPRLAGRGPAREGTDGRGARPLPRGGAARSPVSPSPRSTWAAPSSSKGKLDEAEQQLPPAPCASTRGLAAAHNGLGSLLGTQGRVDGGRSASSGPPCAPSPDNAEAHNNLGLALRMTGARDEALLHFRAALASRADWVSPMGEMAWILATHPSPALRDPKEAVRLGERAAELGGRRDPVVLDALAAAYAASGDWERATATAAEAVALARPRAKDLADDISRRLALYQKRQPFRDPS